MKRPKEPTQPGDNDLSRLYCLAGRFITQQITPDELEEISAITKEDGEDQEYTQTFVILTSTSYLTHFFGGMGINAILPDMIG